MRVAFLPSGMSLWTGVGDQSLNDVGRRAM
jgi:hypothetical protein